MASRPTPKSAAWWRAIAHCRARRRRGRGVHQYPMPGLAHRWVARRAMDCEGTRKADQKRAATCGPSLGRSAPRRGTSFTWGRLPPNASAHGWPGPHARFVGRTSFQSKAVLTNSDGPARGGHDCDLCHGISCRVTIDRQHGVSAVRCCLRTLRPMRLRQNHSRKDNSRKEERSPWARSLPMRIGAPIE